MMRHAEDDKSSNRKGFDGHFRFGFREGLCLEAAFKWRKPHQRSGLLFAVVFRFLGFSFLMQSLGSRAVGLVALWRLQKTMFFPSNTCNETS